MNKRELNRYRRELEGLVDRLGSEVATLRAEALRPVGAETADGPATPSVHASDLGGRAADEGLALELLAPEEVILTEVNAALARIDEGTFGLCETCGKKIARARLAALPYARGCIRCARGAEREDRLSAG